MVALADLVLSAWLVATAMSVSRACGAVYSPDSVIVPVPFVTDQVTAVSLEPETVAANCCCPFWAMESEAGEILTEIVCAADTLTIAEADFVVSAPLTAITV
jgi:hypothetical protein